ncbi:MAG: NAD(P)H-hydrate dehydratase [Ruminococcus sp.]|jgi:NAD(P)H-hydrate epimerase|nr:NAD(P)H-hydrate dehydratase [Ruminococcus sp.]
MYLTPKQMREIEINSEEFGVSRAELMENAGGRICLFVMESIFPNVDLSEGICILAGNGNNGGDGLAAAKNLAETGLEVCVIMVNGKPTTELAKAQYETVKSIPEVHILDDAGELSEIYRIIASAPVIIDCIYGTGFNPSKPIPPHVKAVLDFAGKSSAVKIAVDVPSGGDALSGAYAFGIEYNYTLSLGFDKIGMMSEPLKSASGNIITVDIGIPEEAVPQSSGIDTYKFDPKKVFAPRPIDANKGDFGKLLIIAGSSRYSGAAYFAAAAAVRSGAGLITLASTKDVADRVAPTLPEVMYLPLPADKTGAISTTAVKELSANINKFDVILFGCGVTDSPVAEAILELILTKTTCTKIIDADGIKALSRRIELLRNFDGEIIITPHIGELARLYGVTVPQAAESRLDYARSFAFEHGVTVIAKGVPTYVCGKVGGVSIIYAGNPGLARGGSGDVLAGILAGLCANRIKQTVELPETTAVITAEIAVGLHGAAADKAAELHSVHCMTASDVINSIPEVIKGC